MPAYLIAQINVTDPVQYETYKTLASAAVRKFGGRYLTRGGAIETLEGTPETRRVVLLEFPDMETARNFFNSPDYSAARAAREHAAVGQFILLEGLATPLW